VDEFAEHLHASVVNEKIFPHLTSGFLDTNPAVREATVKVRTFSLDAFTGNFLGIQWSLFRLGDDSLGAET